MLFTAFMHQCSSWHTCINKGAARGGGCFVKFDVVLAPQNTRHAVFSLPYSGFFGFSRATLFQKQCQQLKKKGLTKAEKKFIMVEKGERPE